MVRRWSRWRAGRCAGDRAGRLAPRSRLDRDARTACRRRSLHQNARGQLRYEGSVARAGVPARSSPHRSHRAVRPLYRCPRRLHDAGTHERIPARTATDAGHGGRARASGAGAARRRDTVAPRHRDESRGTPAWQSVLRHERGSGRYSGTATARSTGPA